MSAQQANPHRKLKFMDPAEFTPHFSWRNAAGADRFEHLFCEDADLVAAGESFGTPTYFYSAAAIAEAYGDLDRGLKDTPHTL